MTVAVLPARSPARPLNGEQIAVGLEAAGLYDRAALGALVTAQVTADHLAIIVELGGPQVGPGETVADAWAALAETVATGMSADEARQWRALGLGEVAIEALRGNLDLAVVTAIMTEDTNHQTMLPTWASLTRDEGIPDTELPGWVRAGLITPFPASPEGVVRTIVRWRTRLGCRAVHWAAAGYTLDEACRLDRAGGYDREGLGVLAALRDRPPVHVTAA